MSRNDPAIVVDSLTKRYKGADVAIRSIETSLNTVKTHAPSLEDVYL